MRIQHRITFLFCSLICVQVASAQAAKASYSARIEKNRTNRIQRPAPPRISTEEPFKSIDTTGFQLNTKNPVSLMEKPKPDQASEKRLGGKVSEEQKEKQSSDRTKETKEKTANNAGQEEQGKSAPVETSAQQDVQKAGIDYGAIEAAYSGTPEAPPSTSAAPGGQDHETIDEPPPTANNGGGTVPSGGQQTAAWINAQAAAASTAPSSGGAEGPGIGLYVELGNDHVGINGAHFENIEQAQQILSKAQLAKANAIEQAVAENPGELYLDNKGTIYSSTGQWAMNKQGFVFRPKAGTANPSYQMVERDWGDHGGVHNAGVTEKYFPPEFVPDANGNGGGGMWQLTAGVDGVAKPSVKASSVAAPEVKTLSVAPISVATPSVAAPSVGPRQ